MVKRSPMSGGASSLLRSTTQCTFLSILLVVLATLLACISVPPLPVKPQLHSGEPPDIPHHLIERRPRLAPGSYLTDTRTRFANLSPPPREGAVTGKNTVAVVLNWSRFQNVRRIVSLLCGSELDSIMRHVLVWNNSPEPRTYQDFTPTSCSEEKLEIINSMENMYFYARFLGCSQSDAEYCFVQDDDYLVLPEVIQTLHTRVTELERPGAVHLLPPHERLSSDLRAVHGRNLNNTLHTSFSWLGHGTIMHRSLASELLSLLQILNFSREEMRMADNYFSVLRNHPPETWFDQGIELGGGQAFTVGSEGHERNKRHILRAGHYLDRFLDGDSSAHYMRATEGNLPSFTSQDKGEVLSVLPRGLAACFGRPCLFETTIALLPGDIKHSCESARDMLDLEEQNLRTLGDNKMHYLANPPSLAVDGRPDTAFRSFLSAAQGDTITLDMLRDISTLYSDMQITLLVDHATEPILQTCMFETSLDGYYWSTLIEVLACVPVELAGIGNTLLECNFAIGHRGSELGARYFRARLTGDREEKWAVFEMWIRGHED